MFQALKDTRLPTLSLLYELIFRANQCFLALEKKTVVQFFPSPTQWDHIWPKRYPGGQQMDKRALPDLTCPLPTAAASDMAPHSCTYVSPTGSPMMLQAMVTGTSNVSPRSETLLKEIAVVGETGATCIQSYLLSESWPSSVPHCGLWISEGSAICKGVLRKWENRKTEKQGGCPWTPSAGCASYSDRQRCGYSVHTLP